MRLQRPSNPSGKVPVEGSADTISNIAAGARNSPVAVVLARAHEMGLMSVTTQQVGARLPVVLLEQAKKRTGLTSMTDLLAFALANVAIEDNFAKAFAGARGKLDPDLDIGS